MKAFFNEFWIRLKSESPSFFNRLKIVGGSLIATGTSLKLIENVPPTLSEWAGHFILAGSVMAAMSQLTIKHPDQQ